DLDVFAQLHMNTTGEPKTETLDLPVLLAPYSDDFKNSLDSGIFPTDLIPEFTDKHLPFDASGTVSVDVIEASMRWKVTDASGNVYILEQVLNDAGVKKLNVSMVKQYELDPYTMKIEAAGKLILGIPNVTKTGIQTEFARLSGAFSMEISPEGLTIFATAEFHIGPESITIFDLTAAGLIVVNDQGFAANLEITSDIDIPLVDFNASFNIITNITETDIEYKIADRFLEDAYMSDRFIANLELGTGDLLTSILTNISTVTGGLDSGLLPSAVLAAITALGLELRTDAAVRVIYKGSRWEVTDVAGHEYIVQMNSSGELEIYASLGRSYLRISAGAPQLDGSVTDPQMYIIIMGMGELDFVNTFFYEGMFRIEVTETNLEMQMEGALAFTVLGTTLLSGTSTGYLLINSEGMFGYLD
ncbi:MAG: hypothetical protein AAGU05_13270, partial [Anaerolineaceae bacterium]